MRSILLCILTSLLVGCASIKVVEKPNETVRRGVYAARDAMKVGRFNLADKYLDEVIPLVPPPAKRIKVEPLYAPIGNAATLEPKRQQQVVVLPPQFKEAKVVVENTPEYLDLLIKSDIFRLQAEQADEKLKEFTKEADNQRIQEEAARVKIVNDNAKLNKENGELRSFKYWVYFIFWSVVALFITFVVLKLRGLIPF